MSIDPVTPILDNGTTGLMVVSVLLFITNTIINLKIKGSLASLNKKIEKITNINYSIQKIQESIDNFGEVRNSLNKMQESIDNLKSPISNGYEVSKGNQVMLDNIILPFIDEARENQKDSTQVINNVSNNIINLIASMNTVFQGLISTLKK